MTESLEGYDVDEEAEQEDEPVVIEKGGKAPTGKEGKKKGSSAGSASSSFFSSASTVGAKGKHAKGETPGTSKEETPGQVLHVFSLSS